MTTTYADMVALKADAVAWSRMLRGELGQPRPGWQTAAECADVRTFDVDLCATCPVELDCLRDAVATDDRQSPAGIRGAVTAEQRHAFYHGLAPTVPDAPRPAGHRNRDAAGSALVDVVAALDHVDPRRRWKAPA